MSEEMKVPKHWEVKRLGEVCDKISLNGIKIKQKDYLAECGRWQDQKEKCDRDKEKRVNNSHCGLDL